MNEFLEENYSYLVTMTSIIYCMLGFVLIFFNTPQKPASMHPIESQRDYWLLACS